MKQIIAPLITLIGLSVGAWRAAQEGTAWNIPTEVLTILAAAAAGWIGTIAREIWNKRQTVAQTKVIEATAEKTQADAHKTDAEAERIEVETESTLIAMYKLALEDAIKTSAATSARLEATNRRLDDVIQAHEADRRAHESRGAELEAIRAELAQTNEEMERLKALVEQKNQEREAQRAEIAAQHEEIERQRNVIASQQEQITVLTTAIGERDATIEALKATVAALSAEVETIRQTLKPTDPPG